MTHQSQTLSKTSIKEKALFDTYPLQKTASLQNVKDVVRNTVHTKSKHCTENAQRRQCNTMLTNTQVHHAQYLLHRSKENSDKDGIMKVDTQHHQKTANGGQYINSQKKIKNC